MAVLPCGLVLPIVGKTTVMTMITKQTIEQGEKVFFFNGEQTKDDFKNNLYVQSVGKGETITRQYKESCIYDRFVVDSKVAELDNLYGDNLILYNNELPRDIDTLLYAMDDSRKKYGTRVYILDNFMQIDMGTENVFQEQTKVMEDLRKFAVNKNVHIHLVAHPRKIERFQTRLTVYDIAGSSNLANKAYNIISIMRVDNLDRESNDYKNLQKEMFKKKYDIEQTGTILEVIKTKGTACGLVGLIYDPERKTFTEQSQITSELYDKMLREQKSEKKGAKNSCPF